MAKIKCKPLPALSKKDIARFWKYVQKGEPDECWPWIGSQVKAGYGQFMLGPPWIPWYAHRIAYFLQHGEDPYPFHTTHSCDYPPCCNGAHLSKDTNKGNMDECVAKGRIYHPKGEKNVFAKLTLKQVCAIRNIHQSNPNLNPQKTANKYKVSKGAVNLILAFKTWNYPEAIP